MSNKAIYQPKNKASEYAKWACNFYVGCSNDCSYCYCKKGILAGTMGGDKPTLKKCFKDETHALEVFEKELMQNLPELQKHGLFFSFTTDPMLPETIDLTIAAIDACVVNNVPVKILTKCDFTNPERMVGIYQRAFPFLVKQKYKDKIAFGFTLTGYDRLEPNASTNQERIEAMKKLHDAGFRTFASIEPIIDFERSFEMIYLTWGHCNLYKIGLMSGQKVDRAFYERLRSFNLAVVNLLTQSTAKVYWKDSITKCFDVFPDAPCNVDRDYNIFKER